MKKLFLLAVCALVAPLFAAAQEATTVIEKFGDKTIKGVIIAGAFDVQLSQADGSSRKVGAKVEILKEVEDKLVFELTEEGYVRVAFKNDMTKYFTGSKKKPQAWITVSELQYLNVTGASNVVCTGICSTEGPLRLLTSGNASVNLLESSAETINIEIGGTSDLSDTKLTATGKTELIQSGTTKMTGTLKTGTAVLTLSGVAGLTLDGGAEEAVLDVSGTSSADLENFTIGTVNAKVSGMSKVKANVMGGGTAEVSTMGSFRYKGDGLVTGKGVKRLE